MNQNANGSMAGEPEEGQEAEQQTYSREEVEAVLSDVRREMQGKLTRAQQEAKEYRLANDSLHTRLARIEERLAQPQRPEPEEDDDSWDDIDSGRKLRDASLKMTRSEIRKALESEGAVAKAALQKVADLELRDSIREVSGAYGGLSQEDLNRVMDYGISNGIDDLEICAYKVLGPPNAQTRRVVSDDEEPRQQAPHKPVLVGRGKSQAQAASAKPRQIKVRPGVRGYDDIEREAAQWLKGR